MPAGLRLKDTIGRVVLDLTDRTATVAGSLTRTGTTGLETITIPRPARMGTSKLWAFANSINTGDFWEYAVSISYPAVDQFRFQVQRAPANAITTIYYGWL